MGRPCPGPVKYVYDEIGRLRAAISETTSYDAVGNITEVKRFPSTQVSVLELTPDQGGAGDKVTIQGTAFSATASQNTVRINGVAATVTAATTTSLTVTVPAGATTGTAQSESPFTVEPNLAPTVTGFSPTVSAVGQTVTVSGTNFFADLALDQVAINASSYAQVASATHQHRPLR